MNEYCGGLQPIQRRRLARLLKEIKEHNYGFLVDSIEDYLDDDAKLYGVPVKEMSFTERYMRTMAEEVANAIERGGKLILGCLATWPRNESPYRAVFVWDDDRVPSPAEGLFAFTASRPENFSSKEFDLNDLDRHVSFEVTKKGADDEMPELRIQRWRPGLCNFRGVPRRKVLFPWPGELERIVP